MGNCFSSLRRKDDRYEDGAEDCEQLSTVISVQGENASASKDGAEVIMSHETELEKSTSTLQNTLKPENAKVLADPCSDHELVKTEVKENSSSEETVHVDVGNAVSEPEVVDGGEMFKKDLERKSQAEESDPYLKHNIVAEKVIDLTDRQTTELNGANVQTCSRNAEFGNEDDLVPSAIKLENVKVLADPCSDQESVKTEVKQNSSSEDNVHVDVGNAVAEPDVDDGAEMFKKDFERKSQAEESDSSPKTNLVAEKASDLDDPQTIELKVQSCSRNTEFRNEDDLVPSAIKLENEKVLPDPCSDQEQVKTKVKENSSSEENVHVDVGNAVAEPEVVDGGEMFKKEFERKSQAEPEENDSSPKNNMVGENAVDLDDPQSTELNGANVQTCFRNAEFGNEDDLVATEIVITITKLKEIEKSHVNESASVEASDTEVKQQEVVKDNISSHEKKKTFLRIEENIVEKIWQKDLVRPTGLFRMTVRWKMAKNLVKLRQRKKTFPTNKSRNGIPISQMKRKILLEKSLEFFKAKKDWEEPITLTAYLGAGWIIVKEFNPLP